MLHRTIVAALIVSSDQKILFGKKNPKRGGVYMDAWHIPGGGIEEGETPLHAIKREVMEETGLNTDEALHVELIDDQGSATAQKKLPTGEVVPCHMTFVVYRVEFGQKAADLHPTASDDLGELQWISKDKLAQVPHTPPSISLFLRLGWITADEALSLRTFTNANLETVPYDNSGVSWRVSAYVLIVKDNRMLLAKSKHEKFYDVIGGGIELGESIEDTLYREALEEGGVKIKLGKQLFSSIDWFYHRKGKFHQALQLYYEAEVVGNVVAPTDPDMETTMWVPIQDVGATCKLAASSQVVAMIQEYLSS